MKQDMSWTLRKTNYTISFNWSFSVSNTYQNCLEKSNLQGIRDYLQHTQSSITSSRSTAGAVNKLLYCSGKQSTGTLRQVLLQSFAYLYISSRFLDCRCNMDFKPSIVFLSFYGVPRSNMLLNLHTFNELISVLCAISFGLCHKCHMT